uniref:Uncharacterized protein n=1 Tax=Cacopsylla melanoneura TaxID=428564 RepID=A0A8D8X9G4_9HEMI
MCYQTYYIISSLLMIIISPSVSSYSNQVFSQKTGDCFVHVISSTFNVELPTNQIQQYLSRYQIDNVLNLTRSLGVTTDDTITPQQLLKNCIEEYAGELRETPSIVAEVLRFDCTCIAMKEKLSYDDITCDELSEMILKEKYTQLVKLFSSKGITRNDPRKKEVKKMWEQCKDRLKILKYDLETLRTIFFTRKI